MLATHPNDSTPAGSHNLICLNQWPTRLVTLNSPLLPGAMSLATFCPTPCQSLNWAEKGIFSIFMLNSHIRPHIFSSCQNIFMPIDRLSKDFVQFREVNTATRQTFMLDVCFCINILLALICMDAISNVRVCKINWFPDSDN